MNATYLELECGESFGCNRKAVSLNADWESNWQTKVPVEKYMKGLVCGIHRGAAKRAAKATRWSSARPEPQFIDPYTRPDIVEVILAERKARRERVIAKQAADRIEAELVSEARLAHLWVERSTEEPYLVNRGSDRESYSDRFRDGYSVSNPADGSSWDKMVVGVEQDGNAPSWVQIYSNRRMSPANARALARALTLAANLADERDTINGPE